MWINNISCPALLLSIIVSICARNEMQFTLCTPEKVHFSAPGNYARVCASWVRATRKTTTLCSICIPGYSFHRTINTNDFRYLGWVLSVPKSFQAVKSNIPRLWCAMLKKNILLNVILSLSILNYIICTNDLCGQYKGVWVYSWWTFFAYHCLFLNGL